MTIGKVLIGIPTYDGRIHTASVNSLIYLTQEASKSGLTPVIQFVNHVMVDVARDALAAMVTADKSYTHLCFLDSDVSFERSVARTLFETVVLASHDPRANYDVIAVPYPRRGEQPPTFERMFRKKEGAEVDGNGLLEVEAAATGLMVIPARVLQELSEQMFQMEENVYFNSYAGRDVIRLFYFGIEDGMMVGEDFNFCADARHNGFKVHVLTGQQTTHEGWFKSTGRYEP